MMVNMGKEASRASTEVSKKSNTCVLLFSGGRDSSVAAVRLSKQFDELILVTVTSDHLVGVDLVRSRLKELKPHMNSKTKWINIVPIPNNSRVIVLNEKTCLPCHHAYVAIGSSIANQFNANTLSFGYAGYQSWWPEQTPYATNKLAEVLAGRGLQLALPVYDVGTKEGIIAELADLKLSTGSLEQKCLQQVYNIELDGDTLKREIDEWARGIENILSNIDQAQFRQVASLNWSEF